MPMFVMFVKVHKSSSIAGTVWDDRLITEGTLEISLTLLK